jgi:dephospho-CoA kinase
MTELSAAALQASAPLLVHDVPLLFETGWNREYPEILVVYAPREAQLERLVRRNGFSVEEAEQRIAAQMPIDEKRELATWVLDNSGTPEQTHSQFDAWWTEKISRNVSV